MKIINIFSGDVVFEEERPLPNEEYLIQYIKELEQKAEAGQKAIEENEILKTSAATSNFCSAEWKKDCEILKDLLDQTNCFIRLLTLSLHGADNRIEELEQKVTEGQKAIAAIDQIDTLWQSSLTQDEFDKQLVVILLKYKEGKV